MKADVCFSRGRRSPRTARIDAYQQYRFAGARRMLGSIDVARNQAPPANRASSDMPPTSRFLIRQRAAGQVAVQQSHSFLGTSSVLVDRDLVDRVVAPHLVGGSGGNDGDLGCMNTQIQCKVRRGDESRGAKKGEVVVRKADVKRT